jgi:hypothetical protein
MQDVALAVVSMQIVDLHQRPGLCGGGVHVLR